MGDEGPAAPLGDLSDLQLPALIDARRPGEKLKSFRKVTERTPEHKQQIIEKWGAKIFG